MTMRIILPFALLASILLGCESVSNVIEVPEGENRFNGINADKVSIVTDSETGCKYIYVENGQGSYKTTAMSPLYITGGKVNCNPNWR